MVSAQQSRLKKNFEVRFLNKVIRDKDENMQKLLVILKKRVNESTLQEIADDMNTEIISDVEEPTYKTFLELRDEELKNKEESYAEEFHSFDR